MSCFDPDRFTGLSGKRGDFHRIDDDDVDDFSDIDRGDYPGVLSFSDFRQDKNGMWFVPRATSGSDYSGGILYRSNFEAALEAAIKADEDPNVVPDQCRPFLVVLRGGHGTYALAFHTERTPDDIYEMLAAAEDYPVIDEQRYSEMSMEAQEEAWKSWAENDYKRALVKAFNEALASQYVNDDPDLDLDDVDDDALYEHFNDWAQRANVDWEENDEGTYIRVERVAKAAARNADPKDLPEGAVFGGRAKTEGNRMSDFFFGKDKLPPSSSSGGFMGLGSFDARQTRKEYVTIYEALRRKLGREPTHAELKADVKRILESSTQDLAAKGKLPHQRKQRRR